MKRRAYEATSQTLCATGIVILYAVSYACQAYYHFTGPTVTFGLMVAVTVTAFLLAVRLNAQVVAILGFVGGFLTPPLLATAEDHALALFGYVAILDAGLIAVALKRRWPHLALLAVGGTVFTQIGWVSRFFAIEKALIVLVVFAVFNLLFLAGALIAERRQEGSPWLRGAAVTPPFVTFGFALLWVADLPGLGLRPGWMLGLLLAADLPILALALVQSRLHAAQTAAGVVATVVWGSWTMWHLVPETLHWMLAGTLVLALLHTAFPAVLERMRPGSVPAAWGHWFPVLGLGLATLPVASAAMPFPLLILAVARLPMVDPSPVYGLALLLVGLVLGLGRWLRMGALAGVALGGVLAVEYTWYGTRFSAGAAAVPLVWAVGFTLVFVAYPLVFRRAFADSVAAWATAALAGPLVYLLVHRMIRVAYPNDVMGLVPAAFGGMMLAALAAAVRVLPGEGVVRTAILSWLGGSALFFITLIIPVQFEREWITLGWALEGMALCGLYRRLPHGGLRGVGCGLLAVAFVRLALNPAVLEYHARGTVPVWNWYLYTYGIVAACLFIGARLLVEPRGTDWSRRGAPALYTGGTILAFLLVNIEIADSFAKGPTLTFQFSGDFARDMTYSIAWSLFALLMLVVGVVRRLPAVRYAGMALLGVTVLKLFFHDLVRLSALYRIGAFLGVAVISILASVLYQRFFAASPALEVGAPSRAGQPEDR